MPNGALNVMNGNVGIGTSIAGSPLTVFGGIEADGTLLGGNEAIFKISSTGRISTPYSVAESGTGTTGDWYQFGNGTVESKYPWNFLSY